MSFSTSAILSRLGVQGAVATGGTSSQAGYLPILNSSGKLDSSFITGGGGTLTSVGLSTNASWFTVGNSPLTANGTLALNLTTGLTQNQFLATPNGSSGAVSLRALVANDIPNLSATYLTLSGGTMTGDLTLYGAPVNPNDAATKAYVDQSLQGLSWKDAVQAASPINITISNPGTSTFDTSYTATSGDRIALINQSTASQNGIYIFNGSSSAMTRSSDANTNVLIENATFYINFGATYQGKAYTCNTPPPITLGTTSLTFVTLTSALGAISSIGLTAPSVFSVTNSPLTANGTIGLAFATGQTQNQVLASPNGSSGAVSLRSLLAGDIPSTLNATTFSGAVAMGTNNITGTGTHNATTYTGLPGTAAAGSLVMTGGSSAGGTAGSITTSGGSTGAGGSINTSGSSTFAGGSISMQSNGSNAAGSINTQAGGSITTGAGSLTGPATTGYIIASVSSVPTVTGTPSSSNYLRGDGTWNSPSGAGTVTSFSAGNLTPLFTTSVATATSTPALTFTLSNSAAYSWFGNATSSSGAPSFNTSVIPNSLMPALTGDVTNTAGTVATTVKGINGTTLSGLSTGILYNTAGTPSTATANQIASGLTGTTGTLNLSSATLTIPTLPINQGGTGLTSTSQNFAFIGPTSGSGAPTWRALVAGDIPSTLNATTFSGAVAMGTNNITGTGTHNATTYTGAPGVAAAGSLTLTGGSGTGGVAGNINTNGGSTGAGGNINTSGSGAFAGGAITMQSNGSNAAGSINTQAGGSITTGAGSLSGPATTGYILASVSSVTTVTGTPSSTTYLRGDGTWSTPSGSGLTSVGIAVPSFLNVSGSPLTANGTITIGLSGTALAAANGGTGQTTVASAFTSFFESVATTLGDLVYGGTSGAPTRLAGNTSTTVQILTSTGSGSAATAPAWSSTVPVTAISSTGASSGNVVTYNGSTVGWGTVASGYTLTTYTSNQTVASTSNAFYVFSYTTLGTGITCTLAQASASVSGSNTVAFYIKNINSVNLTITPYSGDTIDGQSSYSLAPYNTIKIIAYASGWYIG